MASEVDICNMALDRLGHQPIVALGENTKAGGLCQRNYARCRDAVLTAHPWNFAIARAELSQDGTAPAFEYDYRFALPSGPTPPYCLKVVRTRWEAEGYASTDIPYRIEGRFLLCNEATAAIEYVARITDPAQFDELFTDVLAQRIAGEIGMALTDNASLIDKVWSVYQSKLVEARLVDAQQGTPREVVDLSPWVIARL